jgi:hypothetical protein
VSPFTESETQPTVEPAFPRPSRCPAKGGRAAPRVGVDRDLGTKIKSQIALALGDKVIYALTRALRRVMRPTFSSLLEPHYKQAPFFAASEGLGLIAGPSWAFSPAIFE